MTAPTKGDVLLGKYRIERVLGSGGMGTVVCARHLHLDDPVAIKLLRPDASQTPATVKRFLREAQAARKIRSEHVVQVNDIGTLESGEPYMVMEYLVGTDLSELPHPSGSLDVESAVEYVLQALEALAEAHAQGIVHRDLKPANLFLTKRADGTPLVKVLDFGISKFRDAFSPEGNEKLTQAGVFVGTPSFAAPEQIGSPEEIDARADIWAIGVVLYSLLTGVLPFKGKTQGETLIRVLRFSPEPPSAFRSGLPKELDTVILRCLEKLPDARFSSAADLATALSPFAPVRARVSVDRISRVLGVPFAQAAIAAAPIVISPTRVSESSVLSDASTEPLLNGRRSHGMDSIAETGMSRTLDRLRSAARTTGMMVFAAIGLAIIFGLIVFVTLKPKPHEPSVPVSAVAPTGQPTGVRSREEAPSPATSAPAADLPPQADKAPPASAPPEAVSNQEPKARLAPPSKRSAPPTEHPTVAVQPRDAGKVSGALQKPTRKAKAPSEHADEIPMDR